jgi:serine/threonine-protein phosphatase 5
MAEAAPAAGGAGPAAGGAGGLPAAAPGSGAGVAAADVHKDEGNKAFAAGRYAVAITAYTAAVEALAGATDEERKARLPALLTNRAFANLKSENYGSAIADAGECLELEPANVKAFYRRGSANLALARYKQARGDFRAVLRVKPGDADATAKLDVCEKAIRKAAFEAAIATEATKSLFERLDVDTIPVDGSYAGPALPAIPEPGTAASAEQCAADPAAVNEHGISLGFVRAMIEAFRAQKNIHRKYAAQLLARLKRVLDRLPSLVHVPIPAGAAHFNVCGDTHGQYYDLLHIFELTGEPSPTNPYLFNGDFVDRGSFSCENVLTLMAWQLLYPQTFWLTRGAFPPDLQSWGVAAGVERSTLSVALCAFCAVCTAAPASSPP